MKRYFLIFVAVVMAAASAMALDPIRWRMNVKMTSADEGIVTLHAIVDEGWHLYSTTLPDDGPKPTQFSFEGSKGVKFTDKLKVDRAPLEVEDPMFEMKLSWWTDKVTFTRKFKVENAADAKIDVAVTFMGCNDMNCTPPRTVNLTYNVKK